MDAAGGGGNADVRFGSFSVGEIAAGGSFDSSVSADFGRRPRHISFTDRIGGVYTALTHAVLSMSSTGFTARLFNPFQIEAAARTVIYAAFLGDDAGANFAISIDGDGYISAQYDESGGLSGDVQIGAEDGYAVATDGDASNPFELDVDGDGYIGYTMD